MKDHVSNKNLDSKFLGGTGLEFQFSNQPHPSLPGLSSTSSCGQLDHLSQWSFSGQRSKPQSPSQLGLRPHTLPRTNITAKDSGVRLSFQTHNCAEDTYNSHAYCPMLFSGPGPSFFCLSIPA